MSKLMWFVIGVVAGDLLTRWLVHIVYIGIIVLLVWSGHHPFHCQ